MIGKALFDFSARNLITSVDRSLTGLPLKPPISFLLSDFKS